MYAPVATGSPIAVVPSGTEHSWFTLMPMSSRAKASHYAKVRRSTNSIKTSKTKNAIQTEITIISSFNASFIFEYSRLLT